MLDRYHNAFSQFKVNDIVRLLYDFFWRDYCDWYLEALKVQLSGDIARDEAQKAVSLAVYVLEGILKALHPVMPFITEEIWHQVLQRSSNESIALSPMPLSDPELSDNDVSSFTLIQKLVAEVRSLRSLFGVPHNSQAEILLWPANDVDRSVFETNLPLIGALGQCIPKVMNDEDRPRHAAGSVVEGNELFVLLEGLISFDKERERLHKEISNISSYVISLQKKLSNRGFADNAPADVIAKEREKLSEAEDNLLKLKANLTVLND